MTQTEVTYTGQTQDKTSHMALTTNMMIQNYNPITWSGEKENQLPIIFTSIYDSGRIRV